MPDDRECLADEPTREARPIAFPEATGWAEGPSAEGAPFQLSVQPDGTLQALTCWELTDEAIAELVRTRCLYVGMRGERPVAMWIRVIRGNVFYRQAPSASCCLGDSPLKCDCPCHGWVNDPGPCRGA